MAKLRLNQKKEKKKEKDLETQRVRKAVSRDY
jgi:hypothetical protein